MYKSSWTALVVVLIILSVFIADDCLNFGRSSITSLPFFSLSHFSSSSSLSSSYSFSSVSCAPTEEATTTPRYDRSNIVINDQFNSTTQANAEHEIEKTKEKSKNLLLGKKEAIIGSIERDLVVLGAKKQKQNGEINCHSTSVNFNNPNCSESFETTDNRGSLREKLKFAHPVAASISAKLEEREKNGIFNHVTKDYNIKSKVKRYLVENEQELNPDCEFTVSRKPAIYGLRCDSASVTSDGAIIIKAFEPTKLYLIGKNLYSNLSVALTPSEGAQQDDCTHTDRVKSLQLFNISLNVAEVIIDLPSPGPTIPFYFCLRESSDTSGWFHQGSDAWLKIYVKQDFLPFYMKIITIACLLGLSGLFSGLNLGLMALDKNELQVIMKCGSETEKRYARAIEPVRRRGNYLLCSILFSNTLVNSTISVLLEELSDGLIAIMTSTVLIVLFGEILPQAFCSRHGLAVGARTVGLTYFCMIVTFPLSYPVSYCLDLALGEEIGHAYDRERLMEFIQVTRDINNLETDEVNIISGALKIKRIEISEIMTSIEDVYMLDENSVLDFDTIQAIVEKGYSRIPVHESGNRKNIRAVLFAKDLALVDPDDRTPVQTMISFYNHPLMFVFEDAKLDEVLNIFKTGRSHMAFVQRIINDGDVDPYNEIIGVVTLEDVIEEIMQMEINDETDTLTDNRRKRRRKEAQVRKDFSHFTNLGTGDSSFNIVTPQLCLAAYQYLATTVEPFSPKHISDSILKRLLSQKIFYKVRLEDDEIQKRLYTAGEPADYFIMILEGRVHIVCGKENLFFDGGPFSFFGKAALTQFDRTDSMVTATSNVDACLSRRASGATAIISTPPAPVTITKASSSRRESVAAALTGPLSLSTKKLDQLVSEPVADSTSPPELSVNIVKTAGTDSNDKVASYFIPDYTVEIIANTSYLKVTRRDYLTALKATMVEREGTSS